MIAPVQTSKKKSAPTTLYHAVKMLSIIVFPPHRIKEVEEQPERDAYHIAHYKNPDIERDECMESHGFVGRWTVTQ
jgi:hypothetical protein